MLDTVPKGFAPTSQQALVSIMPSVKGGMAGARSPRIAWTNKSREIYVGWVKKRLSNHVGWIDPDHGRGSIHPSTGDTRRE